MGGYFWPVAMDLGSTEKIIAIAVGAVTLGTLFWKKLLTPMYQGISSNLQAISSIPRMLEELDGIKRGLDKIREDQEVGRQYQQYFMEVSGHGVYQAHPNGALYYLSSTLCRSLVRSEQELLGYNWMSWVAHDDLQRVQGEWDRASRTGRNLDFTFHILKGDDTVSKVRMRGYPIPRDTDKASFYFGTIELQE